MPPTVPPTNRLASNACDADSGGRDGGGRDGGGGDGGGRDGGGRDGGAAISGAQVLRSHVPLHLRYDAPSEALTHRGVELPPPLLFLCCHAHHPQGKDGWLHPSVRWALLCPPLSLIGESWQLPCSPPAGLPTATRSTAGCGEWQPAPLHASTLRARVPVGQLAHADLILAGTVISVVSASLGLLWLLWRTPKPI